MIREFFKFNLKIGNVSGNNNKKKNLKVNGIWEKSKLGINKSMISVALIFLSSQFSLLVLKIVHEKKIRRLCHVNSEF